MRPPHPRARSIQFRINHTTDQRLNRYPNATAKAAGWEPRPRRTRAAQTTGNFP